MKLLYNLYIYFKQKEKNHTLNDHHNNLVFTGRHVRNILTLENSSSTILDSILNNTTDMEITEINGTSKNEVKTLGKYFLKFFFKWQNV